MRHLTASARDRRARPRRGPAAAHVRAIATLAFLLPLPLLAQAVLGGDDATVLRRGRVRVRVQGILESSADRFGRGGVREPLGAGASYDTLGLRLLPGLAPVRDTLRLLTGTSDLGLSLGSLTTSIRNNVQAIPFSLEYGLLDRVTLSVVVPYVRTQSSVNATIDPTAGGGNIGFNPADTLTSRSTSSQALARNALFIRQVTAASNALRALGPVCAVPNTADPRCAGYTAANASALLADAAALQSRIGYVYGTGTINSGVRFVPVAGSPLQRAVEARVADLSRRFRGFGVDSLATTSTPLGAQSRLGLGNFQQILTREEFGFAGDSLRGRRLSGTGDVELAATVQWLDTFHGNERARLAPVGLQLRSALTGGYRLGTGSGDFSFVWFDVPTGSGTPAILLRSVTDVVFGRRFSASVGARVAQPMSKRVVVRLPSVEGEVFVPAFREVAIDRTLGRELQLDVTPRWSPTDFFALWGRYQVRTKQRDETVGSVDLSLPGQPPLVLDGTALDAGSDAKEQRAGIGVTYSSMAAFARGHSTRPLEVSWLFQRTVAGSGGAVARVSSQQVSIRLYLRAFGDRTRNVTGVR